MHEVKFLHGGSLLHKGSFLHGGSLLHETEKIDKSKLPTKGKR